MGFSTTVAFHCPNSASYGLRNRMTTSVKGFGSRVWIDSKAGSWGRFGVTFHSPLVPREPATVRLGVKVLCGGDDHTTELIDGKMVAQKIKKKVARRVCLFKEATGRVPGLGIVLFGQKSDSKRFIKNITNACDETGIHWVLIELPDDCPEEQLKNAVDKFNNDPSIQGVHLENIGKPDIADKLKLEKDINGVQRQSFLALCSFGCQPLFIPPSPKGCIEVLVRSGVNLQGRHAVVIGKSLAAYQTSFLLRRHRVASSFVVGRDPFADDLNFIERFSIRMAIQQADIVVHDTGLPKRVPRDWLKPGAVLIDVGTCPIENTSCEHMTIAMLMCNVLDAAKRVFF